MAVDVSQVTALVENDGYEAMFEMYDAMPSQYQTLGRIINPADAGISLYGDRGTVFMGHQRFDERQDLQEINDSTTDVAYTWQAAIKQYSRGMVLPSRLLRSNGAASAVKARIIEFARDRAEIAMLQKDDRVAGMFQRGTLTAGSTEFFDNTYPGNVDANSGFIYDGLPWFDTAHTVAGSATTYSNHTASLALTQANLQTVLTTMRSTNAVNDRGERIMIRPDTIIVPPGLEYTARTILNSTQVTGSGNNDVNPIAGSLNIVVWNALSDAASASSWWVVQRGRGLRIYDSGAPRLWVTQLDNGDIKVNSEYLFGAAVDQWRYQYCANKAAS